MSQVGLEFTIEGGGYRAVITEAGATLRCLTYAGRDLISGNATGEMANAGRGQQLIPWANRIRDGKYEYAGQPRQLPLSEPARRNASHGLVRWAAWAGIQSDDAVVRMHYPLMAQPGYPWSLDLVITYSVDQDGLSVIVQARNLSSTTAPYSYGAHPYLTAGSATVDADTLHLAAASRVVVDPERLLPVDLVPIAASDYDFCNGKLIGDLVLDDCFGGLHRPRAQLRSASGTGVEIWGDDSIKWMQVFTADGIAGLSRRAVAIEPMTAPPDCFNSKTDLIEIQPGATHALMWGIRAI